ncbi:MAG: MFS transporter [Acidimicrobiales bacterium]
MSLWRHRDFRRLWGGETVSELGSQVSLVAIPLLAVRVLHASPFEMGVLTASSTAAFLLVGLPAGVWVDRLSHRSVMIAADIGRLLAMISIPIAYALGSLGLPQLYVVALVAGVFTVFFDVAYQSYLPSLVGLEAVTEGNAKLTTSAEVAQVAGPSVAGGLVQAFGSAVAVTADAVSFAFSAVAITAIRARTPPLHVPERREMRREIAEGLRFVWGHRLLRAIAETTATSNFFSGIVAAIEIVFLVRVVHVEPVVIGLILACAGAGGVLGAVTAARISAWIGGARATIVGIACSVSLLLLPLSTTASAPWLFSIGWFISGIGVVLYNVNQVSFRQRLCPPALLGRMNATMRFIVWGVLPIGALIGGVLGQKVGLRPTLWVGAVGGVSAIGWLLASPLAGMRDFPTEPPTTPPPEPSPE